VSFVPLLLAALVSSSGDEVIARVDQLPITRAAVSRRIESAAQNHMKLSAVEALDSLVTDALFSAEARRLGLGGSREVAAIVDREVRKAAAAALVESFASRREADETSLREMFHSTADFVAYEFLAYASEQDARAARQRIEKGASFASEAAGAVTARLYPKAADAPLAIRAQLGGLASPLFAAAPGVLAGPMEGENGWLLARVLRKQIGSDSEFAARRPALVKSFHKQTLEAGRSHLVEQLKAKSPVKLDEAFLKSLRGAEASREQLEHVIATVAGAPVRYADVYPRIAPLGGQAGHMASPGVKIQLATMLVGERLLEAFAVERGFDKAPEVAVQRPELERNAFTALVVARIHTGVKRPTSREIESHYKKSAARYAKPLAEVRRYVEAEVLEQKRDEAVQARLEELRAKASISIDEAALARAAT
jgi:hypothetical protein